MRRIRSNDETAAIEAVRFVVSAEGHAVTDDPSVTDRPDWVFALDDVRVGAECTCINLKQLMAWSGRKGDRIVGKHYEVRFANEPHFWVKKALESKNPKVVAYLERAKCSTMWLILHSEDSSFPLLPCTPEMLSLMRAAAASMPSGFDAVWFAHSETGAHRLWRRGDPACAFPELKITDTYPTLRIRQGIAKLGPGGGEFSMGPENAAETVVIQPLDRRYRI